jgi:uncharacterized protein (DUF1800 family)
MASLTPLNEVLGIRRAKHLLRRATFNFSKSEIENIASLTPLQAVTSLLNTSVNVLAEPYDPSGDPPDGYWTSKPRPDGGFTAQARKRAIVTAWWWYNAINQVSIKHKMIYFWFTSFTIGKDSNGGTASQVYDYFKVLEYYALGNIKDLAYRITYDNSMLIYLDNTSNNKGNPNENYAREFLELFTILKGEQIGDGNYTNYTEADIQQAAKLLSGFKKVTDRSVIDATTNIASGYANPDRHDKNDKTFSSAFNNQVVIGRDTEEGMFDELRDFVEMVFAQQETAKAYCRKLYRFFVKRTITAEVENDIIMPLAQTLIDNNYNITFVLQELLMSQHFYDADDSDSTDENIGAIIKSPLQLVSEVCSMFEFEMPDPNTLPSEYYVSFFRNFIHNSYFKSTGMDFFNPDSVAGYPAHYQEPDYDRHWFASNTLIARYKLIESLITGRNTIESGSLRCSLNTVNFIETNISTPNIANLLVSEVAELLYPETIDNDRITYFVSFLVDGYDEYYWKSEWEKYVKNGDDSVIKPRLDALITAMVNAAEFQLM